MSMTNSLSDADVLFINKLEEVACRTNQNVLSEADANYARSLLSVVSQNAQQDSKDSLQPVAMVPSEAMDSRHISILSIALAPHRRIPPEILIRIFQFLPSCKYAYGCIPVPPVLYDIPWVLGQVCTLWRQLSRSSVPHIWGMAEISFDLSPEENCDDEEELLKLKCFVDIYPDICHLYLSIREPDVDADLVQGSLIPYLFRVDSLFWEYQSLQDRFPHSRKELMMTFPPGIFSRLQKLYVQLLASQETDTEDDHQVLLYSKLFGPSPRIRDLNLHSDSPHFLLSGIPWLLLRTLTLDIAEVDPSMQEVWARMAPANPFCTMTSLETLTLRLPGALSTVILSLDFPWHQISSLTLEWPANDPPSVALIIQALSECTILSKLDLLDRERGNHQGALFTDFGYNEQLSQLSLISLNISGGFPSPIIKSIAASVRLLTLTIHKFGIKLKLFYHILEQCPNLRYFVCTISDSEPVQLLQAQKAAHLKTLKLAVSDALSFPLLESPSLTSFNIDTTRIAGVLVAAVNFFRRSNAKLQEFNFNSSEVDNSPDQELIGDLLLALHPCIRVSIQGLCMGEESLELISSRLLLPNIKLLALDTFNHQALLSMIEHRLDLEKELGPINLRVIFGYLLEPVVGIQSDVIANLREKAKELKEKYGVTCHWNLR